MSPFFIILLTHFRVMSVSHYNFFFGIPIECQELCYCGYRDEHGPNPALKELATWQGKQVH